MDEWCDEDWAQALLRQNRLDGTYVEFAEWLERNPLSRLDSKRVMPLALVEGKRQEPEPWDMPPAEIKGPCSECRYWGGALPIKDAAMIKYDLSGWCLRVERSRMNPDWGCQSWELQVPARNGQIYYLGHFEGIDHPQGDNR